MYANYSTRLRQMSDARLMAELNLKGEALNLAVESGHTNRWHVFNAGKAYLKTLEEVERRKLTEKMPVSV